MSLASSTVRRIAKELAQLRSCPPEGCRVVERLDDDDITQFMAWVAGP
jgi:ubiquitin-protein ligase